MTPEIKIFGIRHHGAGSAKRLYEALLNFTPEAICIEMPYESKELLTQLKNTEHKCPLAFLFYNKNNTQQTMYYPFAEFSPEYQALKHSFERNIPVHPIDLPAGISMVYSNFKKETESGLSKDQQSIINDPLGYLARKSGYKDTERWWDSYFESWTKHDELFDIIHGLMIELRNNSYGLDDFETLAREEFMRQEITKLSQTNISKIAIVCGAWHSPALLSNPKNKFPKIDLDKLKSVPVQSSIIPWSYPRLALNKYYSAGIESPQWSECIFNNSETAISQWLSIAADKFRKNGFNLSTAELIDTERMVKELAMLREIPIAGIVELIDASIIVIGKGEEERINLFKNQMIIGDKIGHIEINEDTLSLIREFKSNLKELRLSKFWSEGNEEFLALDLRKEKHLQISRFLHRTILLKLDWCQTAELEINAKGNFHENWNFEWSPEKEMHLIEAAIQGTNIEEVIQYYLLSELEKSSDLSSLSLSMEHGLKANLPHLWPLVLEKINLLSIKSNEVEALCTLLRPFISSISYGNLYQMDVKILEDIIKLIIPKIILEFGSQCCFIKEDKAKNMLKCVNLISTYFLHSADHEYESLWVDELIQMSTNESIHPIIRGKIWYKILEENYSNKNEFLIELEYQFLHLKEAQKTAYWIEGFMYQSTQFFLMQDLSLELMNLWISELDESKFKEVLPLLRRTFSELSSSERKRIKIKLNTSDHSANKSSIHYSLEPLRSSKMEELITQTFATD